MKKTPELVNLKIRKLSFTFVSAQKWQNHFGVSKPRGSKELWNTKTKAYKIATKLFPKAQLTTKRGRVLDGRSDALLIAEYGRREAQNGRNRV